MAFQRFNKKTTYVERNDIVNPVSSNNWHEITLPNYLGNDVVIVNACCKASAVAAINIGARTIGLLVEGQPVDRFNLVIPGGSFTYECAPSADGKIEVYTEDFANTAFEVSAYF